MVNRYKIIAFSISLLMLVNAAPINGAITWNYRQAAPLAGVYVASGVAVNAAGDTCIYIFGGIAADGLTFTRNTQEYNPATNSWTPRTLMPSPGRYDFGGARATRAGVPRIYVAGGYNSGFSYLPYCDEYTPSTNTWATRADMFTAREGCAVVSLGNLIYAIGGDNSVELGTTEAYDPDANSWSPKDNLNTPRVDLGAAVVNGRIYAIGGCTDMWNMTPSGACEEYNPGTDNWILKAPMPTPRWGLMVVAYNDLIYCIGGTTDGATSTNVVQVYNPAFNTWSNETSLNQGRDGLGGGAVNLPPTAFSLAEPNNGITVATVTPTLKWRKSLKSDKIFAICGATGSTVRTTNEGGRFSPLTYTLWYSLYSNFSSYTEVAGLADTFYTTPALVNDTVYYWKVKAIGSERWSNETNWWFRTPPAVAIELSSFSAWLYQGDIKIIWRTESEKDNVRWLIERSYEKADNYTLIGTVEGQGNKPTPTDYTFTDKGVSKEGRYFYRLGAMNSQGETEWNGPVSVIYRVSEAGSSILSVLPSGSGNVKINYLIDKPANTRIELYNITGRRIATLLDGRKEPGKFSLNWNGRMSNGSYAPRGIYFCRIQSGSLSKVVKFVYMK